MREITCTNFFLSMKKCQQGSLFTYFKPVGNTSKGNDSSRSDRDGAESGARGLVCVHITMAVLICGNDSVLV